MDNTLTKTEIGRIKIAGVKTARVMNKIKEMVKPYITTQELDKTAEKFFKSEGLKPSFKNYEVSGLKFPASICVSINDEIVHGIPTEKRFLAEGDIVSIDIGAEYQGIYTDMAVTVPVGKISKEAKKLLKVIEESLYLGIKQAKAGNHIGDIGNVIEDKAKKAGLGVVREYVGHGIGRKPHLRPQIPNFGEKGSLEEIKEGMALAIEPMLTLGSGWTKLHHDGWTVKTEDASLAAHFEHTVIIEDGKPVIITKI